ncbi:MAG: acyltransferase [Holophagales bacterium]|nr:acyltransferase [Holophagales bacterium]
MSVAKRLLTGLLRPAASFVAGPGEGIRRAWAHARLSAALGPKVPQSVVVLGTVEVHGTGRIRLGEDLFLYRGLYLETQGEGEIVLGDRIVVSRGVHVVAFDRIEVGEGSMIGEYSSLRDANHRLDPGVPIRDSGHEAKPIRLGKNVWIGRGVTVLGGVTIGDGAVVGANAVVTRDVAPGAVVAGIPAKLLVRRVEP